MKYLSIQTFQCGISVSGLATFTGGAEINILSLNGATTSSEASLFLGAHSSLEGGQLVLQKGTGQTYAAHLDNYSDQFRVLFGTNTGSAGVAMSINLATRQLTLPTYTSTSSFPGTVAGYLAFDSVGNIITTSLALSGYVPTSRTLTINGTSYDLSADRTWTINTVDYTSRLQHQVKAGVAINKGQAVYVTSADGTNMIVGLASNASEATSSKTMGLLDATVSTNGFANVVTEGLLAGLDTTAAGAEGDPVWLGTGGNLIYGLANKPYAPAHLVFIGIVTRKNANNGEIFVKVQNGFELNEIHDVDLKTTVPVNGHILGFDGTLWVNKTIAGWLGYTPANASGTTNYISKFTGSTTLGNSLIYDDGSGVGIGTTSPSSKLSIVGPDNASGLGVLELVTSSTNLKLGGNFDYSWIQSHNSKPLRINELGNNVILNLGGGNTGIGTSSPSYKLDVYGSPRFYGDGNHMYARLSSGASNKDSYVVFNNTADRFYVGIPANSNNLYIQSGNGGTPVSLVADYTSGNVGIGTSIPVSKLHVLVNGNTSGGPAGNVASFQNSSVGNNAYITLFGSYNAESGIVFTDESEQYKGKIGYNNNTEHMYFQTDGSERMRITSVGNVGIGTSAPNYKLETIGNARISGNLSIGTTYNGFAANIEGVLYLINGSAWVTDGYGYANASATTTGMFPDSSNNITFKNNNSTTVYINSSGNVGIGTTNPLGKLHIADDGPNALRIGDTQVSTIGETNDGGYPGMKIVPYNSNIHIGISSTNDNKINLWHGGSNYTYWQQLSTYSIISNYSTNALVFQVNGGNVLIGTTTDAGYKLYVNGTGYFADNLKLQTGILSFDGVAGYWGNAIKYETGQLNLYQSGDLHLGVGGGNITLYKNTKIPHNQRFTAGGYSSTDGITIWGTQNASAGGDGFVGRNLYYNGTNYIYASTNDNSLWGTIAGMRVVGNSSNALEFIARPATNSGLDVVASDLDSYKRMVISYSGNVGIGTISPTSILDASVSSGGTPGFRFKGWSDASTPYLLSLGTQTYQDIFQIKSVNGLVTMGIVGAVGSTPDLAFQTNSTERMRITSGGNVGIGTTSPSKKLEVADSDIKVNGVTIGKGPGTISGNINHNIAFGVNNFSSYSIADRAHIGIGYNAFQNITGGYYSIAIGGYAMDAVINPDESIAIGLDALGSATYPSRSVAIGNGALLSDTEGYGNVALGARAGNYLNSAFGGYGENTLIGNSAGNSLKNARETTVLGAGALWSTTSNTSLSRANTAIGASSAWAWLSGRDNVWLGYNTNGFINGSYNVIIGANVSSTAIDGAGTLNNSIVLADGQGNVRIFSNSVGNVGIGTTSPASKLHVVGPINIERTGVANVYSTVDMEGNFRFNASVGYAHTFLNNGSELVRIMPSGNVGIGTSNPMRALNIVSNNAQIRISDSTAPSTNYWEFSSVYFNTNQDLFISNQSVTALTINSSGNVGIGTTSPSQLLHVAGNIRVTGAFYDSNNQAGSAGQILKSTGSGTDWVSLSEITGVDGSGTANYVTKWSDADTVTNSLIYDNGTNVGIGTTSPGYNFDVNGQVRVQDKLRVGTVNSGNGVVHMSSSATINPNTTTIVWAQNVSVGMCAFIEYYILNNNSLTDQRAGTIMVTWNQSGTPTIAHTETTTPDIGSTIAVNFTSTLVGSDARINAVNSSANPYTIVMSYKYF